MNQLILFCDLYRSANSDYIVDTLTKQEVGNALSILQTHLLEIGIAESLAQEKITELRDFYEKTFFDCSDEVAIAPRFLHDMMVNTGELSSLIYDKFMKL